MGTIIAASTSSRECWRGTLRVNFIGHAQTWWGNIDRNHQQSEMYPKTPVTPGGITDRLLSDYPNMFGDMSAGSGLNSMLRDEEQARGFLKRHQDKLLFGSDCSDRNARGGDCLGTKILAAIATTGAGQGRRAQNPVRECVEAVEDHRVSRRQDRRRYSASGSLVRTVRIVAIGGMKSDICSGSASSAS